MIIDQMYANINKGNQDANMNSDNIGSSGLDLEELDKQVDQEMK